MRIASLNNTQSPWRMLVEDVGSLASALVGASTDDDGASDAATAASARAALDDDAALARALERYQRARGPAAEALARIVRVAFPFQYDQSVWRAKIFMLGFGVRFALSSACAALGRAFGRIGAPDALVRLPPLIVAPPVAVGVLKGEPYERIWRRARRTTRLVYAAAAALGVFVVARTPPVEVWVFWNCL